jgi:hypothetical protein
VYIGEVFKDYRASYLYINLELMFVVIKTVAVM